MRSTIENPALRVLAAAACCLLVGGCRPATPPKFTPGASVLQLTDGIEDAEELALYKSLQQQVAASLTEYCGTPAKIKMLGAAADGDSHPESDHRLKTGYAIYSRYCVQCHGVNGDGNGPIASSLNPKPRNYQYGVFKFTSTPYGMKPRRSDLMQTLRRGVTGTSMPSFNRLSEEELSAVIDYVLALTLRGEFERELALVVYDEEEMPDAEGIQEIIDRKLAPWNDAANEFVMPLTPMPPMTDETVALGHELFLKQACNKCHGKFGRGGSVGGVDVGVDAWGNKTSAADLTSGMFRGGGRPIDIYRRIYSGINGTPMPAFGTTFKDNPDAVWHLVHFIKKTGDRRRSSLPPLGEADLPAELRAIAAGEAANEAPAGDVPGGNGAAQEGAVTSPAGAAAEERTDAAPPEPAADEPATEEPVSTAE